jgi:HD superfamily phosphohydrolase
LKTNKKKIINDPVFGFISIRSEIIFDLMEHSYFQRLRRIKQLGLSCLVFPGANHTRFEHALGAMHLMRSAISVLRDKGHSITDEEANSAVVAILLHDIGHGPFSHVLENSIVPGIPHECISLLLMEELNREFNGQLETAIRIFRNEYPKKFLHQLVSGQLDVDRLDYLSRDSFYTGVSEGVISAERIIKMLDVRNDQLVVEVKGIYSIEKFLIARRLMYWQVYLHKTVLSAEYLLVSALNRAKELAMQGVEIHASPCLRSFLYNRILIDDFKNNVSIDGIPVLELFARLDDSDIMSGMKSWCNHPDFTLSYLAKCITNRNLFKIKIRNKPFEEHKILAVRQKVFDHFRIESRLADYYLLSGSITNSAYDKGSENINILFKNRKISDINAASDIQLSVLSETVRKYFICYPKELDIK